MNPRGGGAAGYGGVQNRVRNVNSGQARPVKCYNCNGGQDNAFDDDVDEQPVQYLALYSSTDSVTDEAGPSYDLNILYEAQNDLFRAENDKIKQHYKELYDSIKIIRAKHIEQVAIGYKNLLCLTRAKKVQPALYNGHEIIKDNNAMTIVHNTQDTLDIAEITTKKMNDKMKDPECVTRKVEIAPHDYSKENFLATFTPQKQLTPEQIFWSQDIIKLKSEAVKEQTTRITPTGLTEGERGFEQTKECYLKEVIPFFKTLKDNFEGIQKALSKEIKEMKDVFEELEAESVIRKMQASLQGKDNVIRQLKKQISQLQETRSDIDRTLKHYKELYDSIKITRAKHIEQVTALTTENVNLKAQILEKVNSVSKDQVKPKVLTRGKHAIDVEPIVPRLRNNKDVHLDYLRHLKESVETIRDIVEEAKVFIETVRFGNDHFGAIMGYGDYVIGDSVISKVYYVEGLGHNLFSVGQFCDSDLEVAFRKLK
nr:integrase, catalytic region, zinc finger, CCHC-type, peptidase aspartic, catalytic [Tanacetum cinerariifolium]